MAEDPNLNGLNAAANTDPTMPHVDTQKIKNADDVVGGVHLGAIDEVKLTSEEQSQQIDSAVERALEFKPIPMKSAAILTAAAQIRQDFLGINPFLTARHNVTRQIDQVLSRQDRSSRNIEDRIQTINSIIMERTIGARLAEANKLREAQLGTSKNLLQFHTSTMSTFMKQSLALQYRQLYITKDLVTLAKAFADMTENKLEAIKINTKLPDAKKTTFMEEVKKQIKKKAVPSAGKALVEFLSHESIEDVTKSIQAAKGKISGFIQKVKGFKLDGSSMPSNDIGPKIPMKERLANALSPESLWQATRMPRDIVADIIKHSTNKKSPEALLTGILAELTRQNAGIRPEMGSVGTIQTGPVSVPGSNDLVAERLANMGKVISEFQGSFDAFKELYEKNSNKYYDLLKNIDKTLTVMPSMSVGSNESSSGTSSPRNRFFGSLSKFNLPNVFGRKNIVFTDIYRKNNVIPGSPLVSKEQLIKGSVVKVDGRPIKSLRDITGPILDAETGNVLITKEDIDAGLVDVNNKPFLNVTARPKGIGGALGGVIKGTLGVYGAYLGFSAKAIGATGRFLFRKRDKSPYTDVYLKGKITPGKPLVTGEKFREGLIFADGSRVLDVAKITQPVLDPKTGQTLITEDDLKIGLVDIFGTPISKRRAGFSALGGLFDVSKYGIKTAGSLAKPIIGMYAEMFKMMPKAIFGVGSFISKTIVGILSGKAPGAIAKGLVGIAGSITKMYSDMFGMGLRGIGSVGKAIFGGMFGGKKSLKGDLTKKDMYDLVSVRLDHIYSLLDARLANDNIRSGSYQDHENRLKKDRENLVHLRDEEENSGTKGKSIIGRLAGLLGIGSADAADEEDQDKSKDKDDNNQGGIVNDTTQAVEYAAGNWLANRIPGFKFLKGKLGSGLRKIPGVGRFMKKEAGTAAEAVETVAEKTGVKTAAKEVEKLGSKTGLKELLKLGGKSLLKKIPGIGLIAGSVFAAEDAAQGDYVGAAGNVASGLASLIPFFGTAASVGIDGWLAYRDLHKTGAGGGSDLMKARLKVYGVDQTKTDLITQLEARTLQVVISNATNKITVAEAKNYAKQFGFDPSNGPQFQYFCSWIDNRFRSGYLTYLSIVKKFGYNIASGDSIREKDIQRILSEFNQDTSSIVTKYGNLIPTLAAYKTTPAAANAKQITTSSPFQQQSPSNQNTPSSSQSSPTALPITQAVYMVPASAQSPANRKSSTFNYTTGVANTQELTYTPSASYELKGNVKNLPTTVVGDGQCVALVKKVAGLGQTATWQPGPPVVGNSNIKPGTPIATFDPDGSYGNHTDGSSHAAIYLGPSNKYPGGIRVYDQWLGHAPSPRDLRPVSNLPCNSANAFCVIKTGFSQAANNNTPQIASPISSQSPSSPSQSPGSLTSNQFASSSSNVSVPGTSSSRIQSSSAVQTASSNISQSSNVPGTPGPATPVGNAYFKTMYTALLAAAKAQGLPNPEVVAQLGAAQSSLETGYGRHIPGNNGFGIKGTGPAGSTNDSTQEFVNGQMTTMNQGFRKYNSVTQSAADYITLLKTNAQYKGVLAAKNINDAIAAQAASGYATDPYYGNKLASIVSSPQNQISSSSQTQIASNTTSSPTGSNVVASAGSPLANDLNANPNATVSSGGVTYGPETTSSPTGGAQYQTASYTPHAPTQTYPIYSQQGQPYPGYSGPNSNVINPLQAAVSVAETVQQSVADLTHRSNFDQYQQPGQLNIQATLHPDMIQASRMQAEASRRSLEALGGIHSTMKGLYDHMQQVHSPTGVIGSMADNIANQQPGGSPIIAPMINMPGQQQKDCQENIGFSVKKKRDNRYAA